MVDTLTFLLCLAALLLCLPAGLFFAEILKGRRGAGPSGAGSIRPVPQGVGILVPAHNEAGSIAGLLSDLAPEIAMDQVLVVADNCTDDTAAIARAEGAFVIERFDDDRRGKGYALATGVDAWETRGAPDVLVFLDADCRIAPGSLAALAHRAVETGAPVQAEFLMEPHQNDVQGQAVSAFAWYTINGLRQRGLSAMGAPARLNGTGMALPFSLVRTLDLANAHLVEDTMMGITLTRAGHPPVFERAAQVRSTFPDSSAGEVSQRQRWEGGQGQVLLKEVPALLRDGLSGRRDLLLAGLDLTIPPLTRFALLIGGFGAVTLLWSLLTGDDGPLLLTLIAAGLLGAGIVLAFRAYRRAMPDAPDLQDMAAFARLKLKVFRAGSAKGWVRTKRDDEER